MILLVVEFGMETGELFSDDGVFVLNSLKLFNDAFLVVEGGPKGELAPVLADTALERIGLLHCLLNAQLHCLLVS